MKESLKISFDFDDTLSNVKVQRFALKLIKEDHDVHVVTSRMSNKRAQNPRWNTDLFLVTEALGISDSNVHFCNLKPKFEFFNQHPSFVLHLDDDLDEVDGIEANCVGITPILFVDMLNNKCLKEVQEFIENYGR